MLATSGWPVAKTPMETLLLVFSRLGIGIYVKAIFEFEVFNAVGVVIIANTKFISSRIILMLLSAAFRFDVESFEFEKLSKLESSKLTTTLETD